MYSKKCELDGDRSTHCTFEEIECVDLEYIKNTR